MKTQLSLLLLLGCACIATANSPIARAQDAAVTAPMTAAQILEKSRQTYAGFSSYKGSCSVVSDGVFAQGDEAPTQNVSSASAQIEFARGQRLSVEGVDMGGSPFKAQWTPRETWLEQVVGRGPDNSKPGETKREIIKADDGLQPIEALLGGLSGFTGGVGSTIPAALQDHIWSNPFPGPKSQLKLLPSRNLGNVACYVIEATAPELNRVTTYWIEQKTFLLRRMTEEQGERRFDDLPAIDGVKEPIMRVAYSQNQYVFATTEAK